MTAHDSDAKGVNNDNIKKSITEEDLNKFNTKYMELMQKHLAILDMIMNVGLDLSQFARTQKTAIIDAANSQSQSQNKNQNQQLK
jgi:hypothetical protein